MGLINNVAELTMHVCISFHFFGDHPYMEVQCFQCVAHVVIAGSMSCTYGKTWGCLGPSRARLSKLKNTFASNTQHIKSDV